jgi:hypothetical protein
LIPFHTYAQKLSVNYSNQSLTAALNGLSNRYNLKIAFDTQVADKTIINRAISKVSIDEALSIITNGTGLKVQRMGDVYMIIPDLKAKPEENPTAPETKIIEKSKVYIYGVVKDKTSEEALPFASIYLSKNHLGTTTNADGHFRIELNSADTVYIALNYVGYTPVACKTLPQAKPLLQTFFLEPRIEELQAIMVQDRVEVFDNSGMNVERIKFNPSKMVIIPSLSELDISAPIQMLPGISATNENAGGFSIRKSPPDKSLIVYDGFTLYKMNHFFGAFSSVNVKAVKDIQIYKSGFDAHYGGSASGIIEITGKSGNMQKPVVDLGIDMLAADAKIEIPIVKNKCSFLFAGRRSYTDVVKTPLFYKMFDNARYDFTSYYKKPPKAFTSKADDPVYYYNDASTKLTFRPSENSTISLSGFESFDKLGFKQMDVYPKMKENTTWGSQGGSVRWAGKILPVWNSEFITGVSKTSFNYSFGDSILRIRNRLIGTGQVIHLISKSSAINSWLTNATLTWNNTFEVTKGQNIETGFTTQFFKSLHDLNYQNNVNGINMIDTSRLYNKKAWLSSAWLQYQLSGENWDLKPGIRFSRYSIIEKSYPELRLSAIYKLNSSLTFKANAGNYFQFVNKYNIVPRGDFRSVWVISDGIKIPVVSSYSASGGANYTIISNLNLDIEVYYKKTNNLFTPVEGYRVTNNRIKIIRTNLLYDSKVKGVDILIKQTLGSYQLWASYTFAQSVSVMKKNEQTLEYPSDDDQLHELKLLNLLKIKNCVLSVSGIYGSGTVWDDYALDNNLQLSPDYQKNNSRLPAYFRIDAGLNYSIHLGNTELKIGSNFFNILDNKNVINRFDQLSPTPLQDINQGISPLEKTTVYGLGFSYNFFINFIF